VLAVLARVLPEMNVLLTSLPLRVGLGLFMAAAIVSTLDGFAGEIANYIHGFLGS
jgi:flagellar biosynthesis protein FliR